MESDKRYFIEGLFIFVISVAAAFFAVWLTTSGRHDDVLYRIHFTESVSGLTLGDPVKFHGVDVGNVKAMAIDDTRSGWLEATFRISPGSSLKSYSCGTRSFPSSVFVSLLSFCLLLGSMYFQLP